MNLRQTTCISLFYRIHANKKQVIKNLFHYSPSISYKASSIFLMEIARFYCNLMRLLFRVTRAILKYTAHSH